MAPDKSKKESARSRSRASRPRRGRPRGANRTPLTHEERRARNAQYERERRIDFAEAHAELVEISGCDPNTSTADLLKHVTAKLKKAKKEQKIEDYMRINCNLEAQIASCIQRLGDDYDSSEDEVEQSDESNVSFLRPYGKRISAADLAEAGPSSRPAQPQQTSNSSAFSTHPHRPYGKRMPAEWMTTADLAEAGPSSRPAQPQQNSNSPAFSSHPNRPYGKRMPAEWMTTADLAEAGPSSRPAQPQISNSPAFSSHPHRPYVKRMPAGSLSAGDLAEAGPSSRPTQSHQISNSPAFSSHPYRPYGKVMPAEWMSAAGLAEAGPSSRPTQPRPISSARPSSSSQPAPVVSPSPPQNEPQLEQDLALPLSEDDLLEVFSALESVPLDQLDLTSDLEPALQFSPEDLEDIFGTLDSVDDPV